MREEIIDQNTEALVDIARLSMALNQTLPDSYFRDLVHEGPEIE